MGTVAEVKKELAKSETKDLRSLIESAAKELARALPDHMKPERLVRIALTSIRLNPELAKCTPESFLGSLFVAAQTGLEPVGGRSYLLPFNNSRKQPDGSWHTVKECQFVIGYKGLIELFFRHEAALSIDMQTVKENDDFQYQYGTESFLKHVPAIKNRGETIGYYAVAKIKGGGVVFFYLSKEDALAHGQKHSKTFDKKAGKFYDASPWSKEFDAMAMKTCLIQLAKKLPLSVEVHRAIQADESSRDFRKGVGDAFDLPPTTEWNEEKPAALTHQDLESGTSENADGWETGLKVEGIALTEVNQKEAWVVRFVSNKGKYFVQEQSLRDYFEAAAKGSYAVDVRTEDVGQKTWIMEAKKA